MAQIIKATSDQRTYQYQKLDNEIEVLYVNDPKGNQSAVSMVVGVGSFEDTTQGIAHFLEHMLFMGNEKYPSEETYSKFITQHNGSTNAYTAGDHTCYYFSIDGMYLTSAIDIFSQFFVSPTFDPSCVEREINAVDSEHKKNVLVDSWRKYQTLKTIQCDGNSPVNCFSTGNKETLNVPNIREKLIEFYNKYYSSNVMKLVIYDNSLYTSDDEMKSKMNALMSPFNDIRNNHVEIVRECKKNLNAKCRSVNIVPIKSYSHADIIFEIDYNKDLFNNNILNFIEFLLVHNSGNTFYNKICTNDKLVYSMNFGISLQYGDRLILSLNCLLNKDMIKSLDDYNRIVKTIYDSYIEYINVILTSMKNGDNIIMLLYNEFQKINDQKFDNFEIQDIESFVISKSTSMLQYSSDRKNLLKYEMQMENISELILSQIYDVLMQISREAYFLNSCQFFETDQTEKWYNIKYMTNESMSFDVTNNDKFGLTSPVVNKYVNDDIKLYGNRDVGLHDPYEVESDNRNVRMYLRPNYEFGTDVKTFFKLTNPLYFSDIKSYTKFYLMVQCMHEMLLEKMHEFSNANYTVSFSSCQDKYIKFVFSGNIQKLDLVINDLIEFLKSIDIKENILKFVVNRYKTITSNFILNPPYMKTLSYFNEMTYPDMYTDREIMKIIDDITIDDITIDDLKTNLFECNKALIYAEGNITEHQFKMVTDTFLKYITFSDDTSLENVYQRVVDNTMSITVNGNDIDTKNEQDENNAICMGRLMFKQYSDNYEHKLCCLELLDALVSNDFFELLRTKEQLGYIVKAMLLYTGNVGTIWYGYRFIVQSDLQSVDWIEQRIKTFINSELAKILSETSEKEFNDAKEALRVKLLKSPQSLDDYAFKNFRAINDNSFDFNQDLKRSFKFESISLEDVRQFFEVELGNTELFLTAKVG